jgi:hypothetical protein
MKIQQAPRSVGRLGVACAAIVLAGAVIRADSRIKTPLRVVPLWSDEMMAYLTGDKQAACSGTTASPCQRLNSGTCDGTAYFTTGSLTKEHLNTSLSRPPSKQAHSANPQYFALEIRRAASASHLSIFYSPAELAELELVFNCSFSGNDACPTGRFQTGAVQRVELTPLEGGPAVDLTTAATVRPDGAIVLPIGDDLERSIFSRPGLVYQVAVTAECFSVAPVPVEWTLPLYESPSPGAKSAGAIVARVLPGDAIEFTYRSPDGTAAKWEPDWVEPDWGYTFMMDQTILERAGDWFLLPPRPFPRAVWVQLPGRAPSGVLNAHEVYRLTKTVVAPRTRRHAAQVFKAGTNIYIERILDGALEVRAEEPFDMPCGEDVPKPRKMPAYVVGAEQFYDGDLHLRLQPAYTRGC